MGMVLELTPVCLEQCQEAGSSLNLSQACPSQNQQSFQVSCQDPTQSNQCVQLQTILVDGSPCGTLILKCKPVNAIFLKTRCMLHTGYGGTCVEGNCQSAGLLDTIKGIHQLAPLPHFLIG